MVYSGRLNRLQIHSIIFCLVAFSACGNGFDKVIQTQTLARAPDPDCGGLTFSREKITVENATRILRCFNSKGDLAQTVQAWESLPFAVQTEWVDLFQSYLLQDRDGISELLATWQTAKRLEVVGPFFKRLTEFLQRPATQALLKDFFKGTTPADAEGLDAVVKMFARLASNEVLWSELPGRWLKRAERNGLFAAWEKTPIDPAAPGDVAFVGALRELLAAPAVTPSALEQVLESGFVPYLAGLSREEERSLLALFEQISFPLKCAGLDLQTPLRALELLDLRSTAPFVFLVLQPKCGWDLAPLKTRADFSFPAFAALTEKMGVVRNSAAAFNFLNRLSPHEQQAMRLTLQTLGARAPLRSYIELFQESGWLAEFSGVMGNENEQARVLSVFTPERLSLLSNFLIDNRAELATFLTELVKFNRADGRRSVSLRMKQLPYESPWLTNTWTHFANRGHEFDPEPVMKELGFLAESGKLVSFADYLMRLVSPPLKGAAPAENSRHLVTVSPETYGLESRLRTVRLAPPVQPGETHRCFQDRAAASAFLTKDVNMLARAFAACNGMRAETWERLLTLGQAFLGALHSETELYDALSVFEPLAKNGGIEPILMSVGPNSKALRSVETLIGLFPVAGPYLKEPEFFATADRLATLLVDLESSADVPPKTLRFLRELADKKMDRGFRILADKYSEAELVGFIAALGAPVDGVMGHESVFGRIERWVLVFPELTVPLISRFMRAPSISAFSNELEQIARNISRTVAGPKLEARFTESLSLFEGLKPFVLSPNGPILQDLFLAIASTPERGMGSRPSNLKLILYASEAGLLSELGGFIQTLTESETRVFYAILEGVLSHPEFLTEVASRRDVVEVLAKILVSMDRAQGRALLQAFAPLLGPNADQDLFRWMGLATKLLRDLPTARSRKLVGEASGEGDDAALGKLYPLVDPILNWLSQSTDVATRVRTALSRVLR